jgi:hypothetical protein
VHSPLPPWRKAGRAFPLVASASLQDLRFRAKHLLDGANLSQIS